MLLLDRLESGTLRPASLEDLPSMRFDLSDLEPEERRFAESAGRARTIYECAFDQRAEGLAVAYVWSEADETEFRALLPRDSTVERTTGSNYWSDPEPVPEDRFVRLLVPTVMRRLDYGRLFASIARQDFPDFEPRLGGRIYLGSELVFNMYDDRGAIVYARTADQLAVLEPLSDWLVPG